MFIENVKTRRRNIVQVSSSDEYAINVHWYSNSPSIKCDQAKDRFKTSTHVWMDIKICQICHFQSNFYSHIVLCRVIDRWLFIPRTDIHVSSLGACKCWELRGAKSIAESSNEFRDELHCDQSSVDIATVKNYFRCRFVFMLL